MANPFDQFDTPAQKNPFDQFDTPSQPVVQAEEPAYAGVSVQEFAEPMLTLASGAIAEPIAGLAGIAQSLNPFAEQGAGARAVEATREALTYQPRTEKGREVLEEAGELVKPLGESMQSIETNLGDTVFQKTNSPALAAAAASVPTAVVELLGIGAGGRGAKTAFKTIDNFDNAKIAKAIEEALPTSDSLKSTARAVYDEIEGLGATINKRSYNQFVNKIRQETNRAGIDRDITPKAKRAVDRFEELIDTDVPLTDIDTLRKIAQNAANSLEGAEKNLGTIIIRNVDEFLDGVTQRDMAIPDQATAQEIGKKYKIARDMWGRARRSEMLQEAFEKAQNQASGFENGLRAQFRQILNNKKKAKMFKPEELAVMKRVVRGDTKENFARLLGKFGFSEGSATSMLGGSIGVGAGAVAGGPLGAVAVPMIGQVSKKVAQRLTENNAALADKIIRAGRDGRKIAEAYIKETPKAQRSAEELSELLARGNVDIPTIADPLIKEARRLAIKRRAQLAGAIAAQSDIVEGE